MKAILIKNDIGYHLWLNLETKEQEHIASDNPIIDNWGVDLRKYKLSKQNCDEIFGVINVDKLAEDFAKNHSIYPTAQDDTEYGFKQGFNKAMELNKDKVFTEEDVRKAYMDGVSNGHNFGYPAIDHTDKYIKSLQQPTEIEVEIIMETTSEGLDEMAQPQYAKVPKLDENRCLILKNKYNMKPAVEWLVQQLRNGKEFNDELIQQAKEMEKQQKYSIDFIMWYSGMDKDKIENAHKRWINETFKSE